MKICQTYETFNRDNNAVERFAVKLPNLLKFLGEQP